MFKKFFYPDKSSGTLGIFLGRVSSEQLWNMLCMVFTWTSWLMRRWRWESSGCWRGRHWKWPEVFLDAAIQQVSNLQRTWECVCVYVWMGVFLSLYTSVCTKKINSHFSPSKFSLIPFNPESWSNTVKYRSMARIFVHRLKTAQDW